MWWRLPLPLPVNSADYSSLPSLHSSRTTLRTTYMRVCGHDSGRVVTAYGRDWSPPLRFVSSPPSQPLRRWTKFPNKRENGPSRIPLSPDSLFPDLEAQISESLRLDR